MKTPSTLIVFRDIIRIIFVFSFFFFFELTEMFFGIEIELESEYIVLPAILLLGTFWCGWFCPFGNVQYFAGIVGKACFPHWQLVIPSPVDRALRYLKHGFLAMFIFVYATGEYGYFDSHFDMYKSTWYTHAYLLFKKPYAIMFIPLLIPRFFCRYLCYQKAGYQIINACFRFLRIKRNVGSCIECSKCSRDCPMDIDIANADHVTGGECVGCLACVDQGACPSKPSSLQLTWFGKNVKPLSWAVIAVLGYVAATVLMIVGVKSFH